MLNLFCSNTLNNSSSVFSDHVNWRIYNTKLLTHISFLFSIFYLWYHFTFSFTLTTFLLFMTVANPSCYLSPVDGRNRNIEDNFVHKVNLPLLLQAWNLWSYLKAARSYPLKDEMVEFSKLPTSWKIILELMIGNVVIFEVDALTYVVLSKAEKHMPCGEAVGTTECIML